MTSTPEERLARLEKRVHELEAERQELAEGMADGLVKLIYARILLAVGERASSCLSDALSGYTPLRITATGTSKSPGRTSGWCSSPQQRTSPT